MGGTHLAAFEAARADGFDCEVVAVCDRDAARRAGLAEASGNLATGAQAPRLFDPAAVRTFADPLDLLADPDVDLVSVCTPTDTHVDLAIRALEAGKHVLVEKPVALASREVARLADASRRLPGQICMPAMCMRFWPGWDWLAERIFGGGFGPVRSATFQRIGTAPHWGADFYGDPSRSGGALFDLHVHDVDFLRWCFGDPIEVTAGGSLQHVASLYRFDGGPEIVVAEAGWDAAPGLPFRMRFTVHFAEATAEFDLARPFPLLLCRDGSCNAVPLPAETGYDGEIRALLGQILGSEAAPPLPGLDEAWGVTRVLEAERESLETGRPVAITPPEETDGKGSGE